MGLSRKLDRPDAPPTFEQAMDETLERLPAGQGKLSITQFAVALISKLAEMEKMFERGPLLPLCRSLASDIFEHSLNTQEKIHKAAAAKLENFFPAAPEGNETEIKKRVDKINYYAGELAENAFRIMTHGVETQRAV